MASQRGRVSVIILTWNHLDYTKKAIESLSPILESFDEVIIVDNNSDDGTQAYLMDLKLPCSKFTILNEDQCGIAKAYNMALRRVTSDYVFIYDNDLEIVMPNTLDHMIDVFEKNNDAGIVCPCVPKIVGKIRQFKTKEELPNDIQEIKMGYKSWWPECPSAAWLIKREVIDKIGYFDEQFDPYGMCDYDYARRVILSGYKIFADRFIFVNHYGSITASAYVNQKLLRNTRRLFYQKWAKGVRYPKGGTPPAPRM